VLPHFRRQLLGEAEVQQHQLQLLRGRQRVTCRPRRGVGAVSCRPLCCAPLPRSEGITVRVASG